MIVGIWFNSLKDKMEYQNQLIAKINAEQIENKQFIMPENGFNYVLFTYINVTFFIKNEFLSRYEKRFLTFWQLR